MVQFSLSERKADVPLRCARGNFWPATVIRLQPLHALSHPQRLMTRFRLYDCFTAAALFVDSFLSRPEPFVLGLLRPQLHY